METRWGCCLLSFQVCTPSTHSVRLESIVCTAQGLVNSEILSVTVKKIEESILFDFEPMTLRWQDREKMWSLGVEAAVRFIAVTLPLIPLSNGST